MNQPAVMTGLAADIGERYQQLMIEQPRLRARNAAEQLGISEVELLASRTDIQVQRLCDDWEAILLAIHRLGDVMALTRNNHCVHERKGIYHDLSFSRHGGMHMGLAVNPDIDLRLFLNRWRFGYAVTEKITGGERLSLQFFDQYGVAVHKIYTTRDSDLAAGKDLAAVFSSADQAFPQVDRLDAIEAAETAEKSAIDSAALEQDWRNMTDVHQFFPLLKKHKVERLPALQMMPKDLANPVPACSVQRALQQAASMECEVMVFVGSSGCIQIHTGTVTNLRQIGPWFNVLDERFNLHLDSSGVEQCWVTRKPSDDGVITSIEAYDGNGELVVQLFGKRKPGQPELGLWREIVSACECALSQNDEGQL